MLEYYENYKDLDKKIKALEKIVDSKCTIRKNVVKQFLSMTVNTRKEFQGTNINAVKEKLGQLKQKEDCLKEKEKLKNALQEEDKKLDGDQKIEDLEKIGDELKKFGEEFERVEKDCNKTVVFDDVQNIFLRVKNKQQTKLKEKRLKKQQELVQKLEELQRKKNQKAEEKQNMEKKIGDKIETLTTMLNNVTILSELDQLPNLPNGKFDRTDLDAYNNKNYQNPKNFEDEINKLEELYNNKKQEMLLQNARQKALDEISKLPSLQDDNDVYNSFKKAITQGEGTETIKSSKSISKSDDIFNDALDLSKTARAEEKIKFAKRKEAIDTASS